MAHNHRVKAAICGAMVTGAILFGVAEVGAVQPVADRDAWVAYFRAEALPLEGAADLDPLIDQAKSRTLVLLGESTHGTREYYDWRAAISRRLITEGGFRFIAVEGDWEALYALNRYVKDLPGAGPSAREVLLTLDRWPQWMWANASIEELAEWLRLHNADLPPDDRVGIYGVDVYGWGESVELLPGYLNTLEPGWGDAVEPDLKELRATEGDLRRFRDSVVHLGADTSDAIDAIISKLTKNRDSFSENPRIYLKAMESAKSVRQAKRHMRGSIAGDVDGWNARARNFVDSSIRLLDHYGPEARGILWAHNTHIGDVRQTPGGDSEMLNSGRLSRELLGDDAVYLVGFATRGGDVLAGSMWGGTRRTMTMPPALPESFEGWMHEAGLTSALIFFVNARGKTPLLVPGFQRAVGVVYDPWEEVGNYVPTVLPLRYDALIYVDQTHPLEALHP
jgi:erythromycin esterase-like protein